MRCLDRTGGSASAESRPDLPQSDPMHESDAEADRGTPPPECLAASRELVDQWRDDRAAQQVDRRDRAQGAMHSKGSLRTS